MEFAEWLINENHMSSGRIITNPQPKGNYKTTTREWWMIVEASEEIGRFYRKMLATHSMAQFSSLAKPEWGTHVSIVRGEHPLKEEMWNKWDGKVVHFEYTNKITTKDHTPYYWVEARCPDAEAIRLELGLSKEPEYGFHLTFARKPAH
tara:strand:- start:4128 stop:4574 length:447 start_codon:yes stop_codon:yes gene_type:complete